MSRAAFFEHIAIAVPEPELLAWDRLLRRDLGGTAALGGAVPDAGFQGGQITYPGGGMLELLSWVAGAGDGAMKRYVEKHGGHATLHHLTFLVDDLDLAIERSRAIGYEPMIGRRSRNWEEFFVRDRGMRPAGMLIQVLRTDKDALRSSGWDDRWPPFTVDHGETAEPSTVAGVTLATADAAETTRLLTELLGAEADGDELSWPGSSMRVTLVESEDAADSFVALSCPKPMALEGAGSLLRVL